MSKPYSGNKKTLLKYLNGVLQEVPGLSMREFDSYNDKPATERVYRSAFGTWEKAKKLAQDLKPGNSDLDNKAPVFDIKAEQNKKRLQQLRKENTRLRSERLTTEEVRKYIFELKDTPVVMPEWLVTPKGKQSIHGIPSLLLSDIHFGEVIKADQVFNVNEYNMDIAEERMQMLAQNTVDILTNHLKSDYPGLVLLLDGDIVSGTIHDELIATNEEPIMPVVVRAFELLGWFIQQMKEYFPKLMIFCCPGNHGRTTKKVPFKNTGLLSYDWLIYTLLDRYFEADDSVSFVITPGDDLQYKIYNHGYRLTHGSQFRGGQGFLGHIAPVTRGEIRKRTAAESYNQSYDTLVIGHFHSYGTFKRVICNGSIVGYSEYSINNNYPYERPQQALWLTHPQHNITFHCPVFVTKEAQVKKTPWVSWPGENN